MSRVTHILLLTAALVALLAPATAAAPIDVVQDCSDDGDLDRRYPNGELRKAIDEVPSDLDEYSDCKRIIEDAITKPSGGGAAGEGGAGGAGGTVSPDEAAARADDVKALEAITGGADGERPSIDVGGTTVKPGENGSFDLASAANGLPLPLLLALIAVGMLTGGGGLYALRQRVPALARIPLPTTRISLPRVRLPRFRR